MINHNQTSAVTLLVTKHVFHRDTFIILPKFCHLCHQKLCKKYRERLKFQNHHSDTFLQKNKTQPSHVQPNPTISRYPVNPNPQASKPDMNNGLALITLISTQELKHPALLEAYIRYRTSHQETITAQLAFYTTHYTNNLD